MELTAIPFFVNLKNSKNILISGCGGGYDNLLGYPYILH